MADVLQKSNDLISLDRIVGLRAWGLILYGALPSNLALLGALKVEIGRSETLLPFLLPASILPIFLTFMLIRARHGDWYLTIDFLILRSVVTTIMILLLATSICGFSGIIRGKYSLGIPDSLDECTAIAESFLLAIVSLVLSSTLFIAVLTKNSNLPGLPSDDFVKLMTEIRSNTRKIKGSDIWKKYIPLDDNELIKVAEEVKHDIDQAFVCTGNHLAKRSLEPIREDIIELIEVLVEIRDGGSEEARASKWRIYFAHPEVLSSAEKPFRASKKEQVASLERLKRLKLGDRYA